ncbi:hypothetical protein KR074_001017 [Drosophila pseudoananassae]|nr:hypothetical protein KR074_001017 [Drosophila pseudoananassae]
MPEKLLKISYQGDETQKKINAYLRMPSQTYSVLRREIELYLFTERHLPQCEIRTFWIDTDNDEIEIVNQNDYDIFLAKCEQNMHVQIAPLTPNAIKKEASSSGASSPSADDLSNFTIHDHVECDGCGLAPIVGFRYKCVQCSNFDLCQKCETEHKHPDHLMIRMPTNDGPSLIDAYITGSNPHGRRCGRRSRGHCPFAESTQGASAAPSGDAPRESRRERRHNRRNVFSQIMEVMANLPLNEPTLASAAATAAQSKPKEPAAPAETPTAPAPESVTPKPEDIANVQKEGNPSEEKKNSSVPKEASPINKEPETTPNQGTPTQGSVPTTPVISLENLSQMVPPECMRAGIEILNNFSEMFAKMIDPTESTPSGSYAPSMSSGTEVPKPTQTKKSATSSVNQSGPTSVSSSFSEAPLDTEPLLAKETASPKIASEQEPERRRSDSLDHDWQMVDGNGSPSSSKMASTDALINIDSTGPPAAPQQQVRDFGELSEMLRQHINEEARIEHATANTQTSQVDTVSTSTSTTSVSTNSVGTSPAAPEEKRSVPVYHTNEGINSAIHAMMAMGFSNEGAWLTQLLESVNGNIPAALDVMHLSQNRN